jgi:uncharacterized protein YndB with AHSA1/START domain
VRIAAAPAEVFPFFIDPALMIQWLGDWADLRPERGGTFAVDINATPVRGEYVELDPPHRVVFTWGVPGREGLPPGSTTVEVLLSEDGAETVVQLFHHGLPDHEFQGHLSGWIAMLERLVPLCA